MGILKGIFAGIGKVIFAPLCVIFAAVVLFVVLVFVWSRVLRRKEGIKPVKGTNAPYKKRGIFKRLLWDFPQQYARDLLMREPDFFQEQGLIIYTGRQGNGKTCSMVRDTRELQRKYPNCKCITNLGYTKQNAPLNHWKQLIDYKNGHKGVVVCIDELQNWFSCNQSRNFPPEMLQVITQNRKNRRVIFGTAQNFYLLAKAIRSQTVEVRECRTFLGCITVVHRKEPVMDASGDVKEWHGRGYYFYVHDKDLRNSYDTYKVIETLSRAGFVGKSDIPA